MKIERAEILLSSKLIEYNKSDTSNIYCSSSYVNSEI